MTHLYLEQSQQGRGERTRRRSRIREKINTKICWWWILPCSSLFALFLLLHRFLIFFFFFNCIPINSLFLSFIFIYIFILFILFLFKSHIVPFPCPFCLLPFLSYFCFKFYFLPFYALFLFLTFTISPSCILSKTLFFSLVSSHSFPFLIIFLSSFHFYLSLLVCCSYCDYCCFSSILYLFVHYFFISNLIGYSLPRLTSFLLPPALAHLSWNFTFSLS